MSEELRAPYIVLQSVIITDALRFLFVCVCVFFVVVVVVLVGDGVGMRVRVGEWGGGDQTFHPRPLFTGLSQVLDNW